MGCSSKCHFNQPFSLPLLKYLIGRPMFPQQVTKAADAGFFRYNLARLDADKPAQGLGIVQRFPGRRV